MRSSLAQLESRISEILSESLEDEADQWSLSRGEPEISLEEFLIGAWPTMEPNHPFTKGQHIDAMCDHGEALVLGYSDVDGKHREDLRNLIVNIPPGTTKSGVFSVAFPCWIWTFWPSCRILLSAHDDDLCVGFSDIRRSIIRSEWYRDQWPVGAQLTSTSQRRTRDTVKSYTNIAGGEHSYVLVGGKVLGKHPHVHICDDPHNPKPKNGQEVTPVELRDAMGWYDSQIATRGKSKEIRIRQLLVMQRLDVADMTAHHLDNGGWEHLCLPMRFNPEHSVRDPKQSTCLGFVDWRTEKGELLCPERFGEQEVGEIERDLRDEHRIAGQLGQEPRAPAGHAIKREWFRMVDTLPDPTIDPVLREVRHWDLAATEGGGDWTVGLRMAMTKARRFYVIDIVRGQWNPGDRDNVILQTAMLDGRRVKVTVEREGGSGGAAQCAAIVRLLAGFKVEEQGVTGKKFVRADPFLSQLAAGNIHLLRGPWNTTYVSELTALRRELKDQVDDQLDGSSGAFNALAEGRSFNRPLLALTVQEEQELAEQEKEGETTMQRPTSWEGVIGRREPTDDYDKIARW